MKIPLQLMLVTFVGLVQARGPVPEAVVHVRAGVARWLQQVDAQLREVNSAAADVTWALATAPGAAAARLARRLSDARNSWKNARCARAERLLQGVVAAWLLPAQRRQLTLLCRGPKYTLQQSRRLAEVGGRVSSLYAEARVCKRRAGPCFSGEPDLERVMGASRDPAQLLWAWASWRRAVGPPVRPLYSAMVALLNQGARNNGYRNIGECWKEELESGDLESVVNKLYKEVEPMYRMLHAVVRFRLFQYYGPDNLTPDGLIPAHLLGNMWAQSWETLLDIIHPGATHLDITTALHQRNYTTISMVKRAEDFYTSLGLPPMSSSFWKYSQIDKHGENASCHGTAANMFKGNDYRMLLCAEVGEEDFYVIHHEMGHIEYYMAYHDQPVIFQDGANSAFQEAIGDAIMYGVMTPQHLQRLGLVNDSVLPDDFDIVLLLRQGLSKIPQLPFGLVVDKWRWNVFDGTISSSEYNHAWWKLRERYQGVMPPVIRSTADFDPASKFHIPDNTPYIRYFLSGILQVQIFKGLCEATVLGEVGTGPLPMPLHRCDIYGSKDAGDKLRLMMELGCSKPWQEALHIMTGKKDYDVKPFKEYYAPLTQWLQEQIQKYNIPVGWEDMYTTSN